MLQFCCIIVWHIIIYELAEIRNEKMHDIHKRTYLMPCTSFPLLDWFAALKVTYWFLPLVQQFTHHLIDTPTIKPASIPKINICLGTLCESYVLATSSRLLQIVETVTAHSMLTFFGCNVLLVQSHDSFYLKGYSHCLQHLHFFNT